MQIKMNQKRKRKKKSKSRNGISKTIEISEKYKKNMRSKKIKDKIFTHIEYGIHMYTYV